MSKGHFQETLTTSF